MPNVKLTLEYDGSAFHGWQMQDGDITAQGALHSALETVLRCSLHHVNGSGRTDAGVHARGQVANVHIPETVDLLKLSYAVSSILRGKLSIVAAEYVPDSFDARHHVRRKHYRYRILNRNPPATLDAGKAWQFPVPLDVSKMHEQLQCLVGEHDFSSFRAADCGATTPVKRIFSCAASKVDEQIVIDIVGRGFLKNMVRIIVGSCVEIGAGQLTSTLKDILMARSRDAAGQTAPAQGLYLERVFYGEQA